MFQEIPVNVEHIVAFKAIGKLSHEDYQKFLPKIEPIIERAGKISLLLELEDFHGWDLAAAKDDYQFGKKYDNKFARIAIVGDQQWEHWLATLAKPFTGAEVAFFCCDRKSEAWDWLREPFQEKTDTSLESNPSLLPEWHHILIATDFSPHSERAMQRAANIARQYQTKLTILHAVEEVSAYDTLYDPMTGGYGYPISYADTVLTQKNMDVARERIEVMIKTLNLPDVQVEVTVEVTTGTAKSAILSYIEAQQVDMVVMGSHGRKGLARLLGSTTNSLLNSARCEVLSVPL